MHSIFLHAPVLPRPLSYQPLLPGNILFCQQADTSDYAVAKPLRIEDLRAIRGAAIDGPMYAPVGYGKGAIAQLFGLFGFVDDKELCLLDVRKLTPHDSPLLLQALFRRRVDASEHTSIVHCETWDSIVSAVRGYVGHGFNLRVNASTRPPAMISSSPPWRKRHFTMTSTSHSSKRRRFEDYD